MKSWNSSHGSRGCSQEQLKGTGGAGLFYCSAMQKWLASASAGDVPGAGGLSPYRSDIVCMNSAMASSTERSGGC